MGPNRDKWGTVGHSGALWGPIGISGDSRRDWGRVGMKSELHIGFNSPLNTQDTENITYGCRANNPEICRFYMLDGICAFVCDDQLCRHPSRSWMKQYKKLKEAEHD